jgi:hypothetical protein
MCKSCIHQHFWDYTLFTVCLGWWSIISFLLTPFIVLHNIIRYLFCLPMPPVPRTPPKDAPTAPPTDLQRSPMPSSQELGTKFEPTAPPTELRNTQMPGPRKIEVIWELPEPPVDKRQETKPLRDRNEAGGNKKS